MIFGHFHLHCCGSLEAGQGTTAQGLSSPFWLQMAHTPPPGVLLAACPLRPKCLWQGSACGISFRLHLRSQPGQGDWQRQRRKLGCGAREGAMGVGCPPRHQFTSERRLFPALRQPGRGRRRAGGWCSAPIPPRSRPGMSPPLQFPVLLKTGPKMGFSF